ncbi:MAG TPA: hypothetical protein DD624_02155 [Alphaproteobacteria bacterium]|nr:hypothetical protein [Alphaproteobacteria bacterium]
MGGLRVLQEKNIELLAEFASFCEQKGVGYWLDFGTLLGAVRHKGFVPWDDDVDVSMLWPDLEKILPEIRSHFCALGFDVRECETSIGHYQVRINKENNLVGLDVFPVKPCRGEMDKKAVSAKVHKAQNELIKQTAAANIKDIADIRGKIKEMENRFICDSSEEGGLMYFYGIDFPHEHEIVAFKHEELFPLQKMEFEGRLYSCPFNPEAHLKDLYGDYMTFPVQASDEAVIS